jgi:serine/threonine-protein kinase HipA
MPSGAARAHWERELALPNTPRSDWAMLVRGGGNPPGNLRIAEAAPSSMPGHRGFPRSDVVERKEGFIEYAREHGAPVSGSSAAQGDSPKFLLREDVDGRWHADGALPDERTKRSWLVKFPRVSHERARDRLVLEAEGAYYRIARKLGARVAGPLTWEDDCLFVPRFDRVHARGKPPSLWGMESISSLAGVSDFGAPLSKEAVARAVASFTSNPAEELRELLVRDVLDVALGNTDNHPRNTAVLKPGDGAIALSPLYDFAPMVLDPQGIARVCRWSGEDAGFPDWNRVVDFLETLGLDAGNARAVLASLASRVRKLPKTMREERVPAEVIDYLEERIRRTAASLEGVRT